MDECEDLDDEIDKLTRENIENKHKPKLAISIYHSVEDYCRIPLLIKEMYPKYKIYIRHHTYDDTDTVCYAIP